MIIGLKLLAVVLIVSALFYGSMPAPRSHSGGNSVLRLLAPEGVDPALASDSNSARGLSRMMAALAKTGRPAPEYLRLVHDEFASGPRRTATFGVGCYWEGERDLGRMPGVLKARTGTLGPDEVVQVEFDPNLTRLNALEARAKAMACFRHSYGSAVEPGAIDSDIQQHYHLSLRPEYHYLPLTDAQAMRVDAMLFAGENADGALSPAQLALKERITNLLAQDPRIADELGDLTPDRSPTGLPAYLQRLEARLDDLE